MRRPPTRVLAFALVAAVPAGASGSRPATAHTIRLTARQRRSSLRSLLVIGAVAGVLMLAGCGGSKSSAGNGVASRSATGIVAVATAAADSATSVHVSASVIGNGVPFVFDLHLVAGKGGEGHLSEQGVGFDLVRIGPEAYVKGSKAFYLQFVGQFAGAGAAQHLAAQLQGRWLKGSATSGQFGPLTQITDIRQLISKALSGHGAFAKTGTTTINGQQVVGVKDTTSGGVVYVATTGKPYLIKIAAPGKETFTFDEWNKSVALAAPANAVDISKLKG
jgi:hypothetical protein